MDDHAGRLQGRDPIMFTRRQFMISTASMIAGTAGLTGCTSEPSGGSYKETAWRTWAHGDPAIGRWAELRGETLRAGQVVRRA